jgi:hypothetical protein
LAPNHCLEGSVPACCVPQDELRDAGGGGLGTRRGPREQDDAPCPTPGGKADPITGFALADTYYLSRDDLARPVLWNERTMAELVGQTVQLRFHMHMARIFAFEFTDD